MRLLIAREAVDAHLNAAGDLAKPDTGLREKAATAVGASGFYAKWLPQLVFGEGQRLRAYSEFGPLATHLRVADPMLGKQAYALAEMFCRQATLRVQALFEALWTNTDNGDVDLTREVLQGRFTWLEDGIVDQSEGTGPWIAHWEAGKSTETNLARRFLTASVSTGSTAH